MNDYSWRERFQPGNEEEAFAIAMQRSLEMDEEDIRNQDRFQQEKEDEDLARALQFSIEKQHEDVDGRREDGNDQWCQFPTQREIQVQSKGTKVTTQLSRVTRTGSDAAEGRPLAIPLCLPNNYEWDPQTQKCRKNGPKRSTLYVINEAIEQLKKIKGPVCVVSVAGTYRQGKSFVLAEAFDQRGVFPLGHTMASETIGIWLWIVPDEYEDCNGRKITVVLLDSEGIQAAASEGFHDHQIFTLTVLLASVLIYNSQGVPTRQNVDDLECIVKLSQRIQIRSKHGGRYRDEDIEFYHKTFPHFIWLLRDATLALPDDCKDVKDYFLRKVFRDQAMSGSGQGSKKVSESILRLFPGFDAFMLPPPTCKNEVLQTINEDRSAINPDFLSGLSEFKRLINTSLAPKSSFNDGEFVTGEGLAALVEIYIEAINTPGAIPNVERAWDYIVKKKCSDAKDAALATYDAILKAQLSNELPRKTDEIRLSHKAAFEECEGQFMAEVAGFSTETVEKYMDELKMSMEKTLNSWYAENEHLTRQLCKDLLHSLKTRHLDPVLQLLEGKEWAKVSFDDITKAYERVKSDYEMKAKGAGDVIKAVFCEFHPELKKEKAQYLGRLRQLKDFDVERAQVLAAKALQDQERERLWEQQARLQQENHDLHRKMERLIRNLDEEMRRHKEQMEKETNAQLTQMGNMVEADLKKAKKEREKFMKENEMLKNRVEEMNVRERENMEMIKNMNAQSAQKEQETQQLLQQFKYDADADKDALIKKINDDHQEEMTAMQTKLDSAVKQAPIIQSDNPLASSRIKQRTANANNLQERIADTRTSQKAVDKPGAFQKFCNFVAVAAPAVGGVISSAVPALAPVVVPIAAGVGAVAGMFSDCSIM